MSKHLELLNNFENLSDSALVALIGEILTIAEDVAFGYDITDDMTERLKEVLDEYEVPCKIVEEDI